jgi:HlyD family secretion protein
MATTAPEPVSAPPVRLASIQQLSAPTASKSPSRPRRSKWILSIAIALVSIGVLVPVLGYLLALIRGDTSQHYLTKHVTKAPLLITVTEDGNVESANNVEVRCQVAGGSNILWIIPDGSIVKKGQEIVRLNSATIEDLVNAQRILFERAQATRIEAEKIYSAAKISVQEYLEGTYVKELQAAEAAIVIAQENLRSATDSLQHTERMARKGYVTPLQLDAQKFAVDRANLDMATAETTKRVLERFTKVKMLGDLESARDSAEAKMRSEQTSTELEHTRLQRLLTQLEQCTILAPQDGMVVYANEFSSGRGSSTVKIEEGAMVRERQAIVRLPDLSQMQVKVIVHESKVDSLAPGMRANVNIQDREFQGEVISVANQPEPTSFFSSSVKAYATIVKIDSRTTGLKPGMTAGVEILVADLKDVLSVPVQTVVEQGGGFACWVLEHGEPQRRPVVLGASNSTVIEIKDGLKEGDEVLLNPRAVVPSAREDIAEVGERVDVAKRFGTAQPVSIGPAAAGKGSPAATGPGARIADGRATKTAPKSFADLDRDGDGKVSRDEAPPRMQEFFEKIDSNHDGFLSSAEMATARSQSQQPRPPSAPGADAGAR